MYQLTSLKTLAALVWVLVTASAVTGQTCRTPPAYDFTLTPSDTWQTTPSRSFLAGACHVYRLNLAVNRVYDFTVCSYDGVGGACTLGDADFDMFDSTGAWLWYLDGDCGGLNFSATTLGSEYQRFLPPAAGYYYLVLSEFDSAAMTYVLAYKSSPVACGDWGYVWEDLNYDCVVDLRDLALLAESWLLCSDPTRPAECVDMR
jgi:hypothetical protein